MNHKGENIVQHTPTDTRTRSERCGDMFLGGFSGAPDAGVNTIRLRLTHVSDPTFLDAFGVIELSKVGYSGDTNAQD